jgi:hypothetical protein
MGRRILSFTSLVFISMLAIGCAHKATVSTVRATNIYSDSDKKVSGSYTYLVDRTSLTKLKKDDTVQGMACSAHHFPIDGGEAFVNSLPHMLEEVFETISKTSEGEGRANRTQLVFRVERFEPRLKFNQKFFGMDAEATVELGVSVVGTRDGKRVFGTTVDTQRSKSGDGGMYCSGGGEVVADATRDAIKDVLEKLGERMANTQAFRK